MSFITCNIFIKKGSGILYILAIVLPQFLFGQAQISSPAKDTLFLKNLTKQGENVFYMYPDSARVIWERALRYNIMTDINKIEKNSKTWTYILSNRADLLYNLGSGYYSKGDVGNAMKNYLEAQAIYEQIREPVGLSVVYNNLGLIYQNYFNNYYKAMNYFIKADSLITSPKQSSFKSIFLSNLGKVSYLLGNTNEANDYFSRALEMARETDNNLAIIQALNQYAEFKIETGKTKEAEELLQESIIILRKNNESKRLLSKALALQGAIYLKKGRLHETEKIGKESLEIGRELNYPSNILSSAWLLYQLYEKKNDWNSAFKMLKLYDEMKDSLTNAEKKNEVFRQQVKFEYQQRKHNDSLAYNLKRQEEELIIEKQNLQIQEDRNLRNLSIIIAGIILVTGWTLNRRLVYRTRLLQNKLKIEQLETEQKLLRTQMNPHFIFNSLNAIQGLILNNQVDQAKKFLINFSILMRSVLEHTTKPLVLVKEEADFLKSFLAMEQLRFKEKIEWSIIEDPAFEKKYWMIPPLIVQPFVEEALIRLLRRTDDTGRVIIRFNKSERFLLCEISDNGVAKSHAEASKHEEPFQRNAMSIALAIQRLEKISSPAGESGSVEYVIDDEKKQADAPETRVIIRIPLKES